MKILVRFSMLFVVVILLSCDSVNKKELTTRPTILKAYVRIFKSKINIKAGEYFISKDESVYQLIKKINEGSVFYRQIRLKEGSTFSEILNLFKNNDYVKKDNDFYLKRTLQILFYLLLFQ